MKFRKLRRVAAAAAGLMAAFGGLHGCSTGSPAFPHSFRPAPVVETALVEEGLLLWLRADESLRADDAGRVSGWQDSAPGKRLLLFDEASTAAPKPAKGKPAQPPFPPPRRVEIAPGLHALQLGGGVRLSTPLPSGWPKDSAHVFLVVRGAGPVLSMAPPGKNPFAVTVPAGRGEIVWSVGPHPFHATCTNSGELMLVELSAPGGGGKRVAVNGTTRAASRANYTLAPEAAELVVGGGFNGEIAEILVYDRGLAPKEAARVGFHLSRKYGIPSEYESPAVQVAATLDLGKVTDVAAVRVEFADGREAPPYTVAASEDGGTWMTVLDHRLSAVPAGVHAFDARPARFVRLQPVLRGGAAMPGVRVFEAYSEGRLPADLQAHPMPAAVWPEPRNPLRAAPYNLLPDTWDWILAHNRRQPVDPDFPVAAPVSTEILLPDGQVVPLQQVKQLFDFNFQIRHFGTGAYNTPENREIVDILSERYRRQLAHPLLWDYVARHAWHRDPVEGTQVHDAAAGTYNRFRRARKNLPMFTYAMGAAGMSNGGNVALATWVKLALAGWPFAVMTHETGHCLGFNDGSNFCYGFQDHMAGHFGRRAWDYEVMDPNRIVLPGRPSPRLPRLPSIRLEDLSPIETPPGPGFRRAGTGSEPVAALGGIEFGSGLHLASETPLRFPVPKGATRFVAVAGIADSADSTAECVLEAHAGEVLVARSPLLAANGNRWWGFDVKLPPGAAALRISARSLSGREEAVRAAKGAPPSPPKWVTIPVETVWCNSGFATGACPATVEEPGIGSAEPRMYSGTNRLAWEPDGAGRRQFAYWRDGARRWETAVRADGAWDGLHMEWHSGGTRALQATYRGGKLDGVCSRWSPEGGLLSERTYKGGLLDGPSRIWRPDGTLAVAYACVNGRAEGVIRKFHADGKTVASEETHAGGVRNGPATAFHPNGKPAETSSYAAGVLDGPHVRHDASGRKVQEETFAAGKLEGLQTTWFAGGGKSGETRFRNGRMDGARTLWHPSGQVAETLVYANGQLNGAHAKYAPNGVKLLEETFAQNRLEGMRRTWHATGAKWQEHEYAKGKLNGLRRDWFATGQPQFEESYTNGVKNGVCRQWDAKGNRVAEQEFENGTPVVRPAEAPGLPDSVTPAAAPSSRP